MLWAYSLVSVHRCGASAQLLLFCLKKNPTKNTCPRALKFGICDIYHNATWHHRGVCRTTPFILQRSFRSRTRLPRSLLSFASPTSPKWPPTWLRPTGLCLTPLCSNLPFLLATGAQLGLLIGYPRARRCVAEATLGGERRAPSQI